MNVNVEVLNCASRNKLELRLTQEYIDMDAEGLFCNKKRKTEIRLAPETEAKKQKIEADVKQEADNLAEVNLPFIEVIMTYFRPPS